MPPPSGPRPGADPARVLVEGPPRSGKTTVASRLAEVLRRDGHTVGGVVTSEVIERGHRAGFAMRDFAGAERTIAHVDLASAVRVGKYGVDVDAIAEVGVPALDRAVQHAAVVIVDEIGQMELACAPFVASVERALASSAAVVATIHAKRHPVTDELRARPGYTLVTVSSEIRDLLPERLRDQLKGPAASASGH